MKRLAFSVWLWSGTTHQIPFLTDSWEEALRIIDDHCPDGATEFGPASTEHMTIFVDKAQRDALGDPRVLAVVYAREVP